MTHHPKGKGCWYFIYIDECPVCGGGREYRERRWTERPESWELRHEYGQVYDNCLPL